MKRCSIWAILLAVFTLSAPWAWADEATLPGQGFVASRYEVLWTKSPFSVASSTEPVASPDYSLSGLSKFDGISYANLIDKQKNEHFVLTSEKPVRGLTLVSIARAQDPANSSVVIQRNGENITLKLDTQPAPGSAPVPVVTMPGPPLPALPNAGVPNPGNPSGNPTAAGGPSDMPPPPLFHRHAVRVPPQPQPQPQPPH